MRTEVEIKAWVDDMDALRERVAARFPHAGSYVKEDVYYRLTGRGPGSGGLGSGGPSERPDERAAASGRAHPLQPEGRSAVEFRLRIDSGEAIVTAKRKSMLDGVEVNDEMEYSVSDAGAFERFAEYLGAEVFSRKRKSGERYRAGEATIELSHVDRLGDFIEIERLVSSSDPALISAADREVRTLLADLGVPASNVEPRYYTDMLASLDGE